MSLIDFSNAEKNLKFYGGESGAKLGIIYENENWLLKYQKSTKGLLNPKLSYTTSPLSEYIGSKFYESFEIPVQETQLGFRDNKVIAACKDFETSDCKLSEFKNIKNTYNFRTFDNGTSGSGTILSEVLLVIETNDVLNQISNIKTRFWDMFVIDAFIGNQDRNNENWGILISSDNRKVLGLAPVYDNGNAFYNKRDIDTFEARLNNENFLKQDAISNSISVYLDDEKHHINPFVFISNSKDEDLSAALFRFKEKYNKEKIEKIINEIPLFDKGYSIISEAQKEFYRVLLEYRKNFIFNCVK